MNNQAMDISVYKKINTPEEEILLSEDFLRWKFLARSIIIETAHKNNSDQHYSDMYSSLLEQISIINIELSKEDYISRMNRLKAGNWAELFNSDTYKPIDISSNNDSVRLQLKKEIRTVKRFAPITEKEKQSAISYSIGILTKKIDVLDIGTVLIQRKTNSATVRYLLPEYLLDATGDTLTKAVIPEEPTRKKIAVTSVSHQASKDVSTIIGTLSHISAALSDVPKYGPIFAAVSEGLNIINLIIGATKPSEFEQLMSALPRIIKDELTTNDIKKSLGHLSSFMDSYQENYFVLKRTSDQTKFIKEQFLPLLNTHLETSSGTLINTINQLDLMWSLTSGNDIYRTEELLSALSLATAYRVLSYQTRIMLLASLSAKLDTENNKTYETQMKNELLRLDYIINESSVSAREMIAKVLDYRNRRNNTTSVYYSYSYNVAWETCHVRDKLNGDKDIESATFWFAPAGAAEAWVKKTRDAHYARIVQRTKTDFYPICEKTISIVSSFYDLDRKINKKTAPQFQAAVDMTGTARYFFSKGKYFKYDTSTAGTFPTSFYPANIFRWGNWPLHFKEFDAGFLLNDKNAYFFKDDEYIAYDIIERTTLDGYPKKITEEWNNWPAGFTHIDAAFRYDRHSVYIFKGDSFISLNIHTYRVDDGYPKKIIEKFPNWPKSGFFDIDCAISLPFSWTYFFKGDQCFGLKNYGSFYHKIDAPTLISDRFPTLYWW